MKPAPSHRPSRALRRFAVIAATAFAFVLSGLIAVPAQAAPDYIYPTASRTVSDNFADHVRRGSANPGTDYAVPVGTSVQAVRAGTVTMSQWWGDGGNAVRIDHGGGVVTEYLHNSVLRVSVGQRVQQGETIALSGNTGSSTGPHLHIVLRINGVNVDFEKYVGTGSGGTLDSSALTYAAVLADGGTAIAKDDLYGSWTTLTGGVEDIAVASTAAGPVVVVLTKDGTVLSKHGLGGTWTTQTSGSRAIALTADETTGVSLAVLQKDGTLIAKTGLNAPWVTLTSGVSDVSIASDPVHGLTVAAVMGDSVVVKSGLFGGWVPVVSPAVRVAVASDSVNGPTIVALSTTGVVWAKTGISAPWLTLTSGVTSIAVASDPSTGPTVGVIQSNGDAIVKSGALNAPWVGVVSGAQQLSINSDPRRGPTMMYLSTAGGAAVKYGIGGTWTTITAGATAIALP
ncbi:M23 family metallopeptidase [Leifsonia shinshuensis]|uniref:M23ase beta-sheet core domain-containing protein n=1 Tax=Leifsonia shinshuensis TaxID=150026 RepID=A0A853CRN2_9MICO|nr:M23 family metallopeptidase [Leifsonia shinshuensis]NYJ23586.1 hypothetical protein [Leifsonia shinshuensis]